MEKKYILDKDIIALFKKFIDNRCDSKELDQVLSYIKNGEFLDEWDSAMIEEEDTRIGESSSETMDAGRKKALHNRIQKKTQKERGLPEWVKYSAAAMVVLALSVALILYNRTESTSPVDQQQAAIIDDIKPGGDVATLTLADGTTIRLDREGNGKLGLQGSSAIVKLSEGELLYQPGGQSDEPVKYNTLTTPRGGQYQITLPDGTKAWLNAASSIVYPTAFTENKRQVTITGEVYFEVKPDKSKPFMVSSAGQTIEVLGTHFNVNAYEDEEVIKTTLLEGSVRITLPSKLSSVLSPGQQSMVINGRNRIALSSADTEAAIGWKNGNIHFNNTDLKGVLRQLARWYNVDVNLKGVPDKKLNGVISRKVELSAVLDAIEKTSNIPLKIEAHPDGTGRRISME